jgi:hypothetical protein
MARYLKPAIEEFELNGDQVVHKPTGATWTAYPGQAEPHLFRRSMLGSALPNGDDYHEHEVTQMAWKLLADRLKR